MEREGRAGGAGPGPPGAASPPARSALGPGTLAPFSALLSCLRMGITVPSSQGCLEARGSWCAVRDCLQG